MNIHHTINYLELPAIDITAMKNFYGPLFGWEFTDYGPKYCEFRDKTITGGFDTSLTTTSDGPTVIFYSNNLDESKKQITEAGGVITIDTFEFPGGKRFHFSDPSANHLAVWTDK